MQTKTAIIIDDERLARLELKKQLEPFPQISIVAEASNADEGIALVEQWKPDIIFLDIQMPERSGFDLLEDLSEAPLVIFTTAYDEYALKAFEFNALDYLLKPIKKERLEEALNRIFDRSEEDSPLSKIQPFEKDHVYIKDGVKNYFILLDEVCLFSSFGNYVKVHFNDQSPMIHRSLNQIEQRLNNHSFFRANRFSIINIKHISAIHQAARSKLKVALSNGLEVELSERKSILFREVWSL